MPGQFEHPAGAEGDADAAVFELFDGLIGVEAPGKGVFAAGRVDDQDNVLQDAVIDAEAFVGEVLQGESGRGEGDAVQGGHLAHAVEAPGPWPAVRLGRHQIVGPAEEDAQRRDLAGAPG